MFPQPATAGSWWRGNLWPGIYHLPPSGTGFWEGGYLCFEEDSDAQIVLRELMDRGLYTAPVNKYFGPGEYSKCIDDTIRVCHPDYWRAHEAGLIQPAQQPKVKERER